MKKFISEFIKRGFMSAAGGPLILSIIYYFIGKSGDAAVFSYTNISMEIISITLMAFIAGGITAIYQNDKLPLASSALIHAAVLYLDYLVMYLFNDWIPGNAEALGIFTAIFAAGYAFVWLIIYLCIRKQTNELNSYRSKKI